MKGLLDRALFLQIPLLFSRWEQFVFFFLKFKAGADHENAHIELKIWSINFVHRVAFIISLIQVFNLYYFFVLDKSTSSSFSFICRSILYAKHLYPTPISL